MRKSTMLIIGALAITFASAVSQTARADSKGEFKKGCEAGHGSYGENVDGVFCNSSGGVHIQCDDKIQHCTASSGANGKVKPIRPTRATLRAYMATGKAPKGRHHPVNVGGAKTRHLGHGRVVKADGGKTKVMYRRSTGPTNPNGPDIPGKNKGPFTNPEHHFGGGRHH